mgnify:CR=1 FL=1
MTARIMRGHGEFCHCCHCEIQIGERWYRYDGVRCTETRKIYHSDTEICYKNLNQSVRNKEEIQECAGFLYSAKHEMM